MKTLKGIEIFSAGEWNGDEYSVDDLHSMVEAFNDTHAGLRPYIKVGHDPKQKVLKELMPQDGMPSAGWIERVYVSGQKLMADFADIPEKIYDLIQKKAYRKVSSEVFWNIKIGGKLYKRLLGAVALLGADTPGVYNLKDILAMYKQTEGEYERLSIDNVNEFKLSSNELENKEGVPMKTENEIKLEYTISQKETELKTNQDALTQAQADKAKIEQENADLKKFKAEAETREAKLAADAETAKVAQFVTELKAEKLCSPAMVPLMTELLGPEKKEYSIKIKDKDEKIVKGELVKELLKLFKAASAVNFEESSVDSKEYAMDAEKEMDKKAKAYAIENKCSYATALKAVMKENQK